MVKQEDLNQVMKAYISWFLKNKATGTLPTKYTDTLRYMFSKPKWNRDIAFPFGKTYLLISQYGFIKHQALFTQSHVYCRDNKKIWDSRAIPTITIEVDCQPNVLVLERSPVSYDFIDLDILDINSYNKEEKRFIKKIEITLKYIKGQFPNLDRRLRQIILQHYLEAISSYENLYDMVFKK